MTMLPRFSLMIPKKANIQQKVFPCFVALVSWGNFPKKTGGCESKILKSPKSEMDLLLECGCLHQASKDLTCVPSCIEPDPIPSDITKDPEGNWVPCLENMRVVTLGVLIPEVQSLGILGCLHGWMATPRAG